MKQRKTYAVSCFVADTCEDECLHMPSQAQHVAEAAIEERNAARKARKRADETVAEYEAAMFMREQMEARVADLRRALMAQQAEETSFSSETLPLPVSITADLCLWQPEAWVTDCC